MRVGGPATGNGPPSRPRPGDPGARAGRELELGPGLRCLVARNPGPLTLDGTRTYVLGSRRVVVLDPGPALEGRVDRLAEALAGAGTEAICLTHAHADHAGCAAEASAALAAPVLAGEATLRRLGLEGRALEDGEEVPIDGGASRLRALATPGHSGDHVSYLWLPGRELFTGDLVLGEGSSLVAHPDGSVGAYLASLSRLIALRPTRLLPGHGPPVEDAAARLEEYRRHRLERDAQVREAVRAGATAPEEIRARVYGELPDPLARAAELSILAHLARLREEGHALPASLVDALETRPRSGSEEGTGAVREP